jgi:phosphoribosylformylglycinamidine cyclo-ligase
MNVNDVICVGARPLALVDYIAVEEEDPDALEAVAKGLREGAERAGVEIPGGEVARLPEIIRGHPSPRGLDLVGACFGTVPLDAVISGDRIEPGHAVLGLPSSGIHSNGLTLARRVLLDEARYSLAEAPAELGRTLAEELLEPTAIYVRAVRELLEGDVDVRGLAHITGDGLLNLLRLNPAVGYQIDEPLWVPPIFELVQRAGSISPAEMHETFNMGTGFCCVVSQPDEELALKLLRRHHAGASRIGSVTADAGSITLPVAGLVGTTDGFRAP